MRPALTSSTSRFASKGSTMGTVHVRGAGHPGDPFEVTLTLTGENITAARAPESIVLDASDVACEADPQIRTVVVQVVDCD